MKQNKTDEQNDDNRDEDKATKESSVEIIDDKTAKEYIEHLRNYFMQEGNENSPKGALDLCYDFVMAKNNKI